MFVNGVGFVIVVVGFFYFCFIRLGWVRYRCFGIWSRAVVFIVIIFCFRSTFEGGFGGFIIEGRFNLVSWLFEVMLILVWCLS